MIEGINIFLPTRGRPERLTKFLESMQETASNPDRLHVVFVLDMGDEESLEATKVCKVSQQIEWVLDTGKPHLAHLYNRAFDVTRMRSDDWAVSMFGDDMVFVSEGWDGRFLAELNNAEGKAIVYGDDDYIQHGKLPVHLVTWRPLVRATRRPFMATEFRADMIDTVWREVGKKAGLLRYLPEVHIRHEHNSQLLPAHRDSTFRRLQQVKPPRAEAYRQVEKISNAIVSKLKENGYV